MVTNPADVLLQEFAECSDPDRAEALLETLAVEQASPGIQKIVRDKLAFQGAAEAQDMEDLSTEVVVELVARLRRIRESGEAPIGDFTEYAAASASHACNEYLRRKYPNRHRLSTRLRYLLGIEKGLAIWEARDSEWLCGFARWQSDGTAPATRQRLDRWSDALQDIPRGKAGMHPADLANTIFERLGAPAPFDELVALVARIWGVEDSPNVPAGIARELGSGESDPGARLDLERWMTDLWDRIRELPLSERVALLLHLRAAGGRAAVFLLPLTGIAGLPQIAETLELPAEELAAMWNRLPLDDLTIADRLGVSRRRVIDLRKSACERLTRRRSD